MPLGYIPPGMRSSNDNVPGGSSGASKGDLQTLEEKYEKLKLVCMAMWTFIKELSPRIDEDTLITRVREIDMMDGSADGKLKLGIKHCHKCKKALNPKFNKCLYCGAPVQISSIFETL